MIIIQIILISLAVFNIIITKRIFNLSTFFTLFWYIICFFSSFHFFDLYDIDNYIYYIVLIGNFFVTCGNLIYVLGIKKTFFRMKKNYFDKLSLLFYLLLGFALLIVCYKIVLMLPAITQYGVGNARNLMQQNENMNLTSGMAVLQAYFAFPYIRAAVILFAVDFIKNKKNMKSLLLVVILSLIRYLSDGSRSCMIDTTVAIVYVLILNYKYISIKIKRRMFVGVIIVFIALLWSTLERGVGVINNLYTYYCGSLVFFSENIDNNFLFNEFLYGANSFQGFVRPIFGVLNMVGIQDPLFLELSNDFLMGVQNTVINIAPLNKMNYFITCFGYFYKDCGFMGIILFSTITGIVLGKIDSLDNVHYRSLSLKLLFLQGIVFSMSKYMFADYSFVMTLLYIIIITSKYFNCIKIRFRKE